MTNATWSGDQQSCSPGAFDAASHARAIAVVNVYRFLANVPEVTDEPVWYDAAQACALLADANDALSHEPPADWACYSELGAQASAVSLIANRSAPHAVDPFIEDSGNEATMVHRRWLLSDKIDRLAFGSTNKFACAVVDGRSFDGPEQTKAAEEREKKKKSQHAFTWSAWPPSGPVPIEALQKTNVDVTGWTVQSSTHSLDNAVASITLDGEPMPVQVVTLAPSLGSLSAVNIIPDGWTVQPDRQYFVHVDSGTAVIDYVAEPTSCL